MYGKSKVIATPNSAFVKKIQGCLFLEIWHCLCHKILKQTYSGYSVNCTSLETVHNLYNCTC